MKPHAICTQCRLATRLTKNLALRLIVGQSTGGSYETRGELLSVCCNAPIKLEDRDG